MAGSCPTGSWLRGGSAAAAQGDGDVDEALDVELGVEADTSLPLLVVAVVVVGARLAELQLASRKGVWPLEVAIRCWVAALRTAASLSSWSWTSGDDSGVG